LKSLTNSTPEFDNASLWITERFQPCIAKVRERLIETGRPIAPKPITAASDCFKVIPWPELVALISFDL
jgi:hypothetical protein